MKNQLINLPNYYSFPFENPTGYAEDLITEEVSPYHKIGEKFFAVFIKSHFRNVPNVIIGISEKEFNSNYQIVEESAELAIN